MKILNKKKTLMACVLITLVATLFLPNTSVQAAKGTKKVIATKKKTASFFIIYLFVSDFINNINYILYSANLLEVLWHDLLANLLL